MIDTKDTIVAIATPPGTGAIAVLRLSGAQAIEIVQKVWKGKNLLKQRTHTIHLGYILNENKHILDQVLVSLFRNPQSYTKEDVVEISCHGSVFIQKQLLELFIRQGARLAKQGEFTLRAFLNGQMDLPQAEAVADLIAADSPVSHSLAIQQMRSGFTAQIRTLREELIQFASLIELELDFGEEDVEFADRSALVGLIGRILTLIRNLEHSFEYGNVLKNGVTTVLAGRPNAGKSTLLNALLNEERAIVSPIAGTTRDTIEENLIIQGLMFRLVDTAGIRQAADQLEAFGVEKTMAKIKQATILVYVYDAVLTPQAEVLADLQTLSREGLHVLVVANKMDVFYALGDGALFAKMQGIPTDHIRISAKQGQDLENLRQALYKLIIEKPLAADTTLLTNTRHYQAFRDTAEALDKVLQGLKIGTSGDIIAMDIRHALRALGEITGQVDVEDLLENIFSKFCIGK
jgi:tRNA modification GTPase